MNRALLFIALYLGFCSQSFGFYSLMDTGELLNRGYHRVQGEAQLILDKPADGLNINGRFATGLNQESDIQAEFGVGSVDFYVAGFWKWIPFPDTSHQPAVGARFGVTYGKINDVSNYGIQATPLISKKYTINRVGKVTPYFGLPIGLQNTADDTTVSLQGVIGTQYSHPKLRHIYFLLEFGFEIDDAFDHISFAVSFDL